MDADRQSLAICNIILNARFDLCDLIEAFEDDNQLEPSWILRDFYSWALKNRSSLKAKSKPILENVKKSLPPMRSIQSSSYIFSPSFFEEEQSFGLEYSSTERPLCDDLGSHYLPIYMTSS